MRLESILPLASVVVLIFLAIKSALVGHWGLVFSTGAFVSLLSLSIWAAFKGHDNILPNVVLQASLVVLVFCTVFYLGVVGTVWVFPALIWLRFAVPGPTTNAMIAVLLFGVPVILGAQGDWANAARLVVTMSLALGYLWLVEGEVLSLRERLGPDEGRDCLTDAFSRQQLQLDMARMKQGTSLGLLLVQIEGFLSLRERLGPDAADAMVKAAVEQMQTFLSGRERVYRIGAADLLIGLPGWRSYECFELGQRAGDGLSVALDADVVLRFGVAEALGQSDFEAAVAQAYDSLTVWTAQS